MNKHWLAIATIACLLLGNTALAGDRHRDHDRHRLQGHKHSADHGYRHHHYRHHGHSHRGWAPPPVQHRYYSRPHPYGARYYYQPRYHYDSRPRGVISVYF